MNHHNRLLAGVVLAFLFILAPVVGHAQPDKAGTVVVANDAASLRARADAIDALVKSLNIQIKLEKPKSLAGAQVSKWREQTTWLTGVRDRYAAHATELRSALESSNPGAGSGFGSTPMGGEDMVAKMAAMNMQFLALQEATQMESRRFQTLSNASQARHDIAMNAIRNMK